MSKEVISRNEVAKYCYLSEALYYLVLGILPKAYLMTGNNNKEEDVRGYCINEEELSDFEEIRSLRKPFNEFKEIVTKALRGREFKQNPYLAEDFRSMEIHVAEYVNGGERNREKFLEATRKKLDIKSEAEARDQFPSPEVALNKSKKIRLTPEGVVEPREKSSDSKLPQGLGIGLEKTMKFVTLQETLFAHISDLINEIDDYEHSLEVVCETGLRRLKRMVVDGKVKMYRTGNVQSDAVAYKANLVLVSEQEAISLISESYKYWNENACSVLIDFDDILNEHPISGEKVHYKLMDLNHQTILDSNISEKVKSGGKSSYSQYKPLREKVEELCREELQKSKVPSARRLSRIIGNIIETKHPNLLKNFQPYQNAQGPSGIDWMEGTFEGWCRKAFKEYKGLK